LEEDFSRICNDCVFVRNSRISQDFRIVVEDPGHSWVLRIYDHQNDLLKQLQWSGGLHNGLQKAVGYIHSHSSPN
jgi:hypothetical protein